MLHRFYDDDRIVDDEPDRKYKRKQRKCVDWKTEERKNGEGPDQRYWYGQYWNERRAPVLQEHKHDDDHQDHRFDKRRNCFLDSLAYGSCCVKHDRVIEVTGETLF